MMHWHYCCLFNLIVCGLSLAQLTPHLKGNFGLSSDKSKDPLTDTMLQFIDRHLASMRFTKSENITVVLGSSRMANKTMLTLLMNEELKVEKTSGIGYEFVDKFHLIPKYARSINPQLLSDQEGISKYYVCPQLDSRTDVKSEILAQHLMQRFLNIAHGVKFLFTIDYWPVSGGAGIIDEQKAEIIIFVTKATKLIKNMDKFSESITLVVLGVDAEQDLNKNKKTIKNAADADILENIANAFRAVRNEVSASPEKVKFIDLFLEQSDKRFTKLAMVHRANQTGHVKDMPWLQNDRNSIAMMVLKKSQIVSKNNDDFEFGLSAKAIESIPKLTKELQTILPIQITEIINEIGSAYSSKESKIPDIRVLNETMHLAYSVIKELNPNEPISFAKQFVHALETLNFFVNERKLNSLLNHVHLLIFLNAANRQLTSMPSISALETVTKDLTQSMLWYNFTLSLYNTMAEWRVQKDSSMYREDVEKLKNQLTIKENEYKNVKSTSLKQFAEKMGSTLDIELEDAKVNYFKCDRLKRMLIEAMTPFNSSCSSDRLVIKGYFVKLSDVGTTECMQEAKYINIYAINKLFFDVDIERTDAEFSFIAPIWEIIDKRTVITRGGNAEAHDTETAPNGNLNHLTGFDGKPGKTGVTPMEYLGIGKEFINEENLNFQSIGGEGGAGQKGGKGSISLFSLKEEVANCGSCLPSIWWSFPFD